MANIVTRLPTNSSVQVAFVCSCAAASSTLLGSIVVLFLKRGNIGDHLRAYVFCMGMTAGVMLYISLFELIMASYNSFSEHFDPKGMKMSSFVSAYNVNGKVTRRVCTTVAVVGALIVGWFFAKISTVCVDYLVVALDAKQANSDLFDEDDDKGEFDQAGKAGIARQIGDGIYGFWTFLKELRPKVLNRPYTEGQILRLKRAKKRFENDHSTFLKVGISTALILTIHNIPEGFATYTAAQDNLKLGLHMSTAIALHNIPEGFSIAVPTFLGTGSKWKAIFMAGTSGLAEVVGAILASVVMLESGERDVFFGVCHGFICGMMVNIAAELLHSGLRYDPMKRVTVAGIATGVFLIMLSEYMIDLH